MRQNIKYQLVRIYIQNARQKISIVIYTLILKIISEMLDDLRKGVFVEDKELKVIYFDISV